MDSAGFIDSETESRLLFFTPEPSRWRGAKGHHQGPQSSASLCSPRCLQLGLDCLFPVSFSIFSSDKEESGMHGAAIPHQTLVVVTDVIPCDPQHSFERSHHSPHFADRTREAHITTDSTFSVKVAGRRVKCWDAPWSLMGVCPAAYQSHTPLFGDTFSTWGLERQGPCGLWLGQVLLPACGWAPWQY